MTTQTVLVQEIQNHGGLPITNFAIQSVAALPSTTYARIVYLTAVDGGNAANQYYEYIVGTGWLQLGTGSGTVDDTAYDATSWNGVTGIAPSKNAVRDQIELLAPKASPALTGTPTAPTAAANNNTTQIATTAYADAQSAGKVDDTAYNAGTWDAVTGIAPSKNAVRDQIESMLTTLAPKASPALTGTPTAPTAAQGTNTTQLATTAMVQSEVTLLAPKASPALTGTPTAPTAAATTNTTQIATTAMVQSAITAYVQASDVSAYKGATDLSTNPNYPVAQAGEFYRASVAGRIGGAAGKILEVGDIYMAIADNAGGNEATVGTSWIALQTNIDGAVIGPTTSTTGNIPTFSNTTGKVIQDSGILATSLAPKASPALTGTPTAPTAAAGNNSTQLATTAYADALVSDTAYNAGTWDAVTGIAPSKNAVRDQIELLAPKASPALTGTPTAPTAAVGTNTTQLATTAYVIAANGAKNYVANIGDGTTEDIVVTHSLGTEDVIAEFRDAAGAKMKRIVPWAPTSVNAITVYFPTGQAPAAAEVRAMIRSVA